MPYALGFDFGSESGRCVLVDCVSGAEVATAVHAYPHGVIDQQLPTGERLSPDWALQHPGDWLEVLTITTATVLQATKILPPDIIGIGTDFTACTVLPTTADGTPLSFLEQWKNHPHAWCKLWKHHAAQSWADRINTLAKSRGEPWLATYGGKISSEWLYPKVAQVADEAPEIYAAAEQWVEAADWIVWQLTGTQTRNACCAGYKGMWDADAGWPSADFAAAVHPALANIHSKLGPVTPIGQRAGVLSTAMAQRMGLRPGIPVAMGIIDAHVALPACGVTTPGVLVAIMGTSCCHIVCGDQRRVMPGMCGVVRDGAVPGLFAYEAGQAGFGDHFAWLSRFLGTGDPGHKQLSSDAAAMGPGGSGLLALDWWNGNRSVLVDARLSGTLVGLTLHTTPADVYRALLEGLAFGTRMVIDTFANNGVPIDRIVASGGMPDKSPLLMQIMADVTGRSIEVAGPDQAGAVGSAIFGALAAGSGGGGFDDLASAAAAMGSVKPIRYNPNADLHAIYDQLFTLYKRTHDHFGHNNEVMIRLRELRSAAHHH